MYSGRICLCTICSVWCKTTLITGGVGGVGADPPTFKIRTFFLISLALSVPIFRKKMSVTGMPSFFFFKKNRLGCVHLLIVLFQVITISVLLSVLLNALLSAL